MARILIIDDNETFRALLLEMLTEAGHTAVAASNGFDALANCRISPPDLILTDIMMPYDGLTTIRILRREFPKLGIIAMSGGGVFRLDYAHILGAHRMLTKPFTGEQLTKAIAEVLSEHPIPKPKV